MACLPFAVNPIGQDKSRPVPGSETPGAHVVYAWDNFVRRSPARNVLIVAHSAGGAGTLHLFRERTGEAVGRCRGVAFTDAVHWFLDGDSTVLRVRGVCRYAACVCMSCRR